MTVYISVLKETVAEPAIKAARRIGAAKIAQIRGWIEKAEREAIEHYAKKHRLELQRHPEAWVFRAKSGEKVAMQPGYYAVVRGVLERIAVR